MARSPRYRRILRAILVLLWLFATGTGKVEGARRGWASSAFPNTISITQGLACRSSIGTLSVKSACPRSDAIFKCLDYRGDPARCRKLYLEVGLPDPSASWRLLRATGRRRLDTSTASVCASVTKNVVLVVQRRFEDCQGSFRGSHQTLRYSGQIAEASRKPRSLPVHWHADSHR